VLLDNGRSRILRGPERQTLKCIRCAACMNACPVYRQTGGHAYGSVYPGPIGAILTPQLMQMQHAQSLPYASSLCGACYEVCPVKINIPEVLIELRAQVTTRNASRPCRFFDPMYLGLRIANLLFAAPGSSISRSSSAASASLLHAQGRMDSFPALPRRKMDADPRPARLAAADIPRVVGRSRTGDEMSAAPTSRQRILASIRNATVHLHPAGSAQESPVLPRDYVRRGTMSREACLALMIERLREYDAEVVECSPDEIPAAIAAQLAKPAAENASSRPKVWPPHGSRMVWNGRSTADSRPKRLKRQKAL
jgi:ferredoxin